MKVWVFTTNGACDGEVLIEQLFVFSNREDALKAFKSWRDDEINYVRKYEYIIDVDREDDFSAHLDGYYATDYTEGYVIEKEVL